MKNNIRKAEISDLERITNIYNWAVENTTASFDIKSQTIEQRAQWFKKHDERHPLIVYELEGKVVGYASLSEYRIKEGYNRTCELSVYVDPQYHNNGIGTKLIKNMVQLGREKGFHVIISGICADNYSSIKIHEKLGFELCGNMKAVGYKFGKYLDCLFYQLII